MKSLILALTMCSTPAWAIHAIYGGEAPDYPAHYSGEPRPHLEERIQFETSFLLDWATFGRRELARLKLNELIKRSAAPHRLMMAYKVDGTREGTMVTIMLDGRAQGMRYFFDTLLNHNIISMVYVKNGIFSTPSDEYKRYWSDTHTAIKREIETKALIQWGAKQKEMSAAQLCSKLLEVQNVQAPGPKPFTFKGPEEFNTVGVRLRKEPSADHEIEGGSITGRYRPFPYQKPGGGPDE